MGVLDGYKYRDTVHIDYYDFRNCYDLERLASNDERFQKDIENLERVIEKLKKYRVLQHEYVQKIMSIPCQKQLILTRSGGRGELVTYDIEIINKPESIQGDYNCYHHSITKELSEEYTGKERHIALKRVKELEKQYNGIEVIRRGFKK